MMKQLIKGMVACALLTIMASVSLAEEGSVKYGGKVYHAVKIGKQLWLTENLDIGTMISGDKNASNDGKIEKYCYDNKPENCEKYGGLYQWNEAMGYANKEKAQGICPKGWHLPTYDEFWALRSHVNKNGNTLKQEGQGSGKGAGTNETGFSALLGGLRLLDGGFHEKDSAVFWSSSDERNNEAVYMNLAGDMTAVDVNKISRTSGFSVRCVK